MFLRNRNKVDLVVAMVIVLVVIRNHLTEDVVIRRQILRRLEISLAAISTAR